MRLLTGTTAVITGGSSPIGLAAARRFLAEGAHHVVVSGRRQTELDGAAAASAEHRDVTHDEANAEQCKSELPMFGDTFPEPGRPR